MATCDEAGDFIVMLALQEIDKQSSRLLQHDTNTSMWEPSCFSSPGLFSGELSQGAPA